VATVCEDYPGTQISKENFVDVQKAVSRLVDGLPEEGFTPQLLDTYWSKGVMIMVCQDQETCDWFAGSAPALTVWEGSRFNGEYGCPAYLQESHCVFLGPLEDMETLFRCLRRLNQGLETRQWWIYECKEEPQWVRLVLSIDQTSVATLEKMK
jgi:hypothetical protein